MQGKIKEANLLHWPDEFSQLWINNFWGVRMSTTTMQNKPCSALRLTFEVHNKTKLFGTFDLMLTRKSKINDICTKFEQVQS